ncbi:MAG: hypothetical protein K1X35_00400 [Caulobacteraceae bacterium]|nr:hypothetical protein [Caulobacteraceae bacterium]
MARFPKIQSPCPFKGDLSAVMDGDVCRLCNRAVVDLTAMAEADKEAFLSACAQPVCVSYRLPAALAAGVVAAAAFALPAAADPVTAVEVSEDIIIVGGITDFDHVAFVETGEELTVPELPVVYEDPDTAAAESK